MSAVTDATKPPSLDRAAFSITANVAAKQCSVVIAPLAVDLAGLHDADARFGISALLGKGEHRIDLAIGASP